MNISLPVGPVALDPAQRAAPQVYEWLRAQILALNYAPGTTLSRAELMHRFGLSQTPIRDALIRLSGEGLVNIFPQAATRVSAIDLHQAIQTHFLRRALELEVVRTLALAEAKPFLRALEATVAAQEAQVADADLDGFDVSDRAFHRILCEGANVPALWDLIRSRSGHIDRLRRLDLPSPGKIQAILASHRAIVKAVAASDAEGAQEHLRTHLSGTLSHVAEIRAAYPDYVRG